jgi:hypothetical protein
MTKRMLDDEEAAAYLGVTTAALRDWRQHDKKCKPGEERGPRVTYFGRLVRYSTENLDDYIERHTVGAKRDETA